MLFICIVRNIKGVQIRTKKIKHVDLETLEGTNDTIKAYVSWSVIETLESYIHLCQHRTKFQYV
jgi:hypothetical protein